MDHLDNIIKIYWKPKIKQSDSLQIPYPNLIIDWGSIIFIIQWLFKIQNFTKQVNYKYLGVLVIFNKIILKLSKKTAIKIINYIKIRLKIKTNIWINWINQ
jgi:hypothetical protein